MKTYIRFGKRIAMPSTMQIRHELRAFCAEEDVREECAAKLQMPPATSWEDIYARRAAQPGGRVNA